MAIVPLNKMNSMPQMSSAFAGWAVNLQLIKIMQEVQNGFVLEAEDYFSVFGIWQPFQPEQLILKPEGQRSWEWIQLHIQGNNTAFETNDRIQRDQKVYKVMSVQDYRLNNFTEYHLCRDYDYTPPVNFELVTYKGRVVKYFKEPVTYLNTANNVTYLGENITYLGEIVTYTE